MMTVTVRHHMSAGHRILGLTGPGAKCANLHGHTFGISWTFAVPDNTARTVEFTNIKRVLREWVDSTLDHGYIVDSNDEPLLEFLRKHDLKHHTIPRAPTTEAIAALIADHTQRALLPGVGLVSVEVTEGPHNAATWTHTPGQEVGQ